MLESDSEIDSHEWEWDSMHLNTSDEEETSPPPPCKDIPVYGQAWIKTFWVPQLEENSTGPTSNPPSKSNKESTINELHTSILTFTNASYELNLIDEVMPIIHPKLIEWNQPNPPCLYHFQNDGVLIDFLELRDKIPSGDHKNGFSI